MKSWKTMWGCWLVTSLALLGCGDTEEKAPVSAADSHSDTSVSSDAGPIADTSDVATTPDVTSPPIMAEIDDEMASFLAENTKIEGAAVLVLHRDKGVLHRKAYGSFDEDRIYFVASSSKMVAAGMINRLHDDGVFDMYAPVADVADWGSAHPDIAPVHLISNSSGLPGLTSLTSPLGYGCQYEPDGELEACAQAIFEAEIDPSDTIVPPDTEFRYGGAQWQVAGGVAEAASGKSWAELFTDIYGEPCGLTHSGFAHQYHFEGQEGAAQNGFPYPDPFDSNLDNLVPTENPLIEGGMYTTMDDYGKLMMMHLKGGLCGDVRVHDAATIDRMHADRVLEVYGGTTELGLMGLDGYGMGWFVDRSVDKFTVDPGAYGSFPYIDWGRDIAVFTVLEESILDGGLQLYLRLRPVIENAVDGMSD